MTNKGRCQKIPISRNNESERGTYMRLILVLAAPSHQKATALTIQVKSVDKTATGQKYTQNPTSTSPKKHSLSWRPARVFFAFPTAFWVLVLRLVPTTLA